MFASNCSKLGCTTTRRQNYKSPPKSSGSSTFWAAVSLEIGGRPEVDATEGLREEILLAFPAYPRCDEADEPLPCEIDPRYLAVDKAAEGDVENPPAPQGDSRWGALDALGDPPSQQDQES